ncbi:MAG: biotin synthase BioB [Candidatus Acididesulfobacter diazotrophicus]|jgi:biotin synthase|uniref:Biotin synthase n=1 Tax=Candidatus Acididesulfobacter diazotrophicus TaxID=2597226 RepID=A0A519BNT9_9DELT|nr:MAG: biotin synthase BioB [Candidatus Acididesulfobacter diazotrophicus]
MNLEAVNLEVDNLNIEAVNLEVNLTVNLIDTLKNYVAENKEIPDDILLSIYDCNKSELLAVFSIALELKEKWTGNKINFCSIVSAKTGLCSEDCAFCGQSSKIPKINKKINKLLPINELVNAARIAKENGANEFSIVTSGTSISDKKELSIIAEAIKTIKNDIGITACASLGLMEKEDLEYLKSYGLEIFHHNIETSKDFFSNICTTHSYENNIETINKAKQANLKVCSGVIIGMGESRLDRIKMAKQLKELDVDNIPINFLNPVKGTPLENNDELTPMECLKTISIFRLINPSKNILAQGGRELNLRQLQPFALMAGANGFLLGNYLVTSGRNTELDIELISDLEFEA